MVFRVENHAKSWSLLQRKICWQYKGKIVTEYYYSAHIWSKVKGISLTLIEDLRPFFPYCNIYLLVLLMLMLLDGITCPRRSNPFYLVTYQIKWVTTSWIYISSKASVHTRHHVWPLINWFEVRGPKQQKKYLN